jgi:hypothetical protein
MGSGEVLVPEAMCPQGEIAHRFRINEKILPFFHWPSRRSGDQKRG